MWTVISERLQFQDELNTSVEDEETDNRTDELLNRLNDSVGSGPC